MTLGKGEALFIHFTIPEVQKNSPIYGVTMGLWLIASGMSPVTPGGGVGRPLRVFSKALWCSVKRLLLERPISLLSRAL